MTDLESTNPQPGAEAADSMMDDDLDVESALAAVASLDQLVAAPDDPDTHDSERATAPVYDDLVDDTPFDFDAPDAIDAFLPEAAAAPDEAALDAGTLVVPISDTATGEFNAIGVPTRTSTPVPTPPPSTLQRGAVASVVPALLLIGAGIALPLLLRTTPDAVTGEMLLAGTVAAGGLVLIAQWIGARRWTGGNLLFGLGALFAGGVLAYLAQPTTPSLATGWPLLIASSGAALLLAGVLTRHPVGGNWVIGGLALLGGVGGWLITGGMLDAARVQGVAPYGIVVPLALLALLIAPLFGRWVR